MSKPKLTVIALTSTTYDELNSCWDFYYITKDLLSEFDVNLILTSETNIFIENSLIIYGCDSASINDTLMEYFQNFVNKKIKFNLYHISNERLNHNCDYYDYANVVFRSYYDPKINKSNVYFLPLGYKAGFDLHSDKLLKYGERKYDINFIGQLKSDRYNLLNEIKKVDKKYTHITARWNDPNSLDVNEMSNVYSNTLLIPCPMGNVHPDSFRICESLESGSIPVIKKYGNYDYFDKIYGNSPIPKVVEWEELSNLLEVIKINPDKKIKEINDWYKSFKLELKNKMFNLLSDL